MIKKTVYTDQYKIESIYNSSEEVLKLRTKIQSQMNNGHAVAIGNELLNPKYIRMISFEEIEEEDYE
ncbi:hypothetical protein [Streptococcus pluranimalium]|uniref:hypothetical protein n=1 Tax=Streptococcus pluranimalium TaxID=82348 RepID=UPI004046B5AD